ncbi:hypothetical protein, partial [Sulfuricurvum sp.]|uniref:hypothetical protein n=1 Tax=Sulfuricurvum sp. TaxID=2025608 RepID=UPI002E374904
ILTGGITIYNSLSNNYSSTIEVTPEEVNTLLLQKSAKKSASEIDTATGHKNAVDLAEKIAKKVLFQNGIGDKDPHYEASFKEITTYLLNAVGSYDQKTSIDALEQLVIFSDDLTKGKAQEELDVYFSIYSQKHQFQQQVAKKHQSEKRAKTMLGLGVISVGVIVSGLFMIALLLIRNPKNSTEETKIKSSTIALFILGTIVLTGVLTVGIASMLSGGEENFSLVVGEQIFNPEEGTWTVVEANQSVAPATDNSDTPSDTETEYETPIPPSNEEPSPANAQESAF